ncbi:MAG: hypothetical protein QOJ71_1486, partial [Actinomycetota bacterium]|nr:hypothetical protein [Actinomycetota bacterium]
MWGQLRLLGPVELIVDGDVVAIGGPRQRAIFAFLALNAGSTVLASKVIDAVWGDAAPSSVGKSFTTMLARLRRSVERCGFTIEYTGGGYRCELPRDGLDVDVFARSFDDAVADLAVGNATAAVHRLRAGLQLWRGDPMEDLADYPFVADVAAALTARRGASEDALANALVQMGVFNEAISLLQGQIAATPYDERRWASLIRTLASAGRQRDALQEFQRIRGQLRDELGIEPGHALRMVERDVLDQLTGRPTALRSGVPFVGRIAALETLQQLLDVASQGAPRAALLEGEPGIGKSALASEFARRAHRGGAVVLDVVCTRSDAVPLRLLSNAVRAALITHTAGQRLAELARVLDTLLDGALTTKDDLTALSRRLAYAIEQACGELARFWPLVVVLDNVQWADAMSLGIVRTLLSAPERPLLLIATLRTTDSNAATSTHFFNDLTQVVAVEHVRLAPLACDEVAALVHAIAPLREEEQAVAAIERASGGNPLYVSQLALLMQSTGGHFPRVLPRSLQILLRERVNDLPAECRRMLDIAAVVGEEFSIEVVASVARRDPLEVAALLDDTHRAGIVRESDTLDRYAFVHGLIRQAVYEEMDEARRARLHDA